MDLRPFIKNDAQLETAKELVKRGLFNYQPFIFSDHLQTGVGLEFMTDHEGDGLVYWPDIPQELLKSPEMKRFILENTKKSDFVEANQRLKVTYDNFVDEICSRVKDVSKTSFADFGCNSGYFPVSFSRKGAREAAGFDLEDYSDCFSLLNRIMGTRASFLRFSYNSQLTKPKETKNYDVVLSMMVLCHISDILQHLAFLGSLAGKSIFIWTLVVKEDDYRIVFGEPNKYYQGNKFPYCFDYRVRPSIKLLKKSLELMGFTRISGIANHKNGIPEDFCNLHNIGIFASRE